jgi:hypothetical protein
VARHQVRQARQAEKHQAHQAEKHRAARRQAAHQAAIHHRKAANHQVQNQARNQAQKNIPIHMMYIATAILMIFVMITKMNLIVMKTRKIITMTRGIKACKTKENVV